jgi:hypothetical protein
VIEAVGLALTSVVIGAHVTLLQLLPCFALLGTGIGFAGSQLTNVILREAPVEKAGAASGANSTARMLGGALGIAAVSAILGAFTIHYAIDNVRAAPNVPPAARAAAVAQIRAQGVSTQARAGEPAVVTAAMESSIRDAIGSAAEQAMRFGTVIVLVSVALSFLIPRAPGTVLLDEELEQEREAELLAEVSTVQ